ncbi:MAG TPA: GNAT family N-acetyltransferase [Dehalococcoidales bacterium]|nr:GNAT family N-acetyltransferase [Dehalococcoidales bacterium]
MATVRTATEKDIPRILELYRQLAFNPPPAGAPVPSMEEYRRVFNKMSAVPGYRLLVAEEDGEILGTTVLVILPGFTHGVSPFAVVEYVVVDEQYRRRGIGKLLMDYVIARSKEAGCYKIMLTSDKRREQAHQFYKSLGFAASAHGFRLYL